MEMEKNVVVTKKVCAGETRGWWQGLNEVQLTRQIKVEVDDLHQIKANFSQNRKETKNLNFWKWICGHSLIGMSKNKGL